LRQSLSEEEAKGIKSLIEEGSKITGPAMGAAIGFLLGGPIGAAIGGGSAYLLQKGMIAIGNDIGKRFLGEREKMRIGGVTMYAADKIQKNLALGMKLRDDGFFEQPQPRDNACIELPILERPPDEEIIEGILLAVQREHEEKKLPFIGNLLANIFFDSSIDKEQANLMIKISETITFTQMCLLAIFSEPYKSKINGRFSGNSAFPKGDVDCTPDSRQSVKQRYLKQIPLQTVLEIYSQELNAASSCCTPSQ
jgi:hypothetical protein